MQTGLEESAPYVPYESTKFPVEAHEQYFAQIVPNTEANYSEGGQATIQALVDRIGPAVLVVHSQSGTYGIGVAVARPNLVKAVVMVEPSRCQVTDANIQSVFARVPLLTMFADFFGSDVHGWPGRMAECANVVERTKTLGGTAEKVYLPDTGIHGNSHMLMMDTNNQPLAGVILNGLNRNAFMR